MENLRDASESIRTSIEQAERSSGTKILSAHIGVTGPHLACTNNRGIVAIPDRERPISQDDVNRALDGSRIVSIPTNREIIHSVPRYFIVDGQEHVTDPVGMFGQRLDVETHIVTGLSTMPRAFATVLLYLALYLFYGRPENEYWGAVYTPLVALGLVWSWPVLVSIGARLRQSS